MIGLSVAEAKQHYEFLDPEIRKELKDRVLKVSCNPNFHLDHILMNAFVRQASEKVRVVSTDMAHIICALLESPKRLELRKMQ